MPKLSSTWLSTLLIPFVLLCFFPGFVELKSIYSSFWLFDNALAASVLILVYLLMIWRYGRKRKVEQPHSLLILLGFFALCVALILNNFLGGFQIVPPILAYASVYLWLGFVLNSSFWKKSWLFFLMLIFTLPILERVQKFIGFPLRMITARIVSDLLGIIGLGNISKSTVIITENYATTIDLPCSGVKSFYFGGVYMLAVYFLQDVKASWKSVLASIVFFLLLLFFNIWRVFALVIVYGVLHLKEIGDSVHVSLGIFGFAVSCVALWFASEYLKKHQKESVEPDQRMKQVRMSPLLNNISISPIKSQLMVAALLFSTFVITNTLVKAPATRTQIPQSLGFTLPSATVHQLQFSDKEGVLFSDKEILFAGKYALNWNQQFEASVLLVKSASARSYHDPELCLQGLGYRIIHEEVKLVSKDESPIKQIILQTSDDVQAPKASVYYWYVSQDKVITDYSQRVWEQFQNKNTPWVLVEVAFAQEKSVTDEQLSEVVLELTSEVRKQFLDSAASSGL